VKLYAWIVSVLVHVFLLVLGSWTLRQKAEFSMEQAPSSVEVDLVAAVPTEDMRQDLPEEEATNDVPSLQPEPDDLVIPQAKRPEIPRNNYQPRPEFKALQEAKTRSDASSTVPGKDSTTLHAEKGAQGAIVRLDTFRNPAPSYPESSRRAGQQGRVLLKVKVNSRGGVEDIRVRSSSGYFALDAAAVTAVKEWIFKPAIQAGVPVSATVEVPISFQLD
jgi:periplasmic protein TonB